MKVETLIWKLSQFDPDDEVIIAKDIEASGFNDIYTVQKEYFNKGDRGWEISKNERGDEYSERLVVIIP